MKKISFIDKETKKLIQYQCADSVNKSKYNEFVNFLYMMKLDSTLSSVKILKSGKTTFDLIKEFNRMLEPDVESIDFGGVLSVFSSQNLYKTAVVKEPIKKFLSLFEFENKKELPITDFEVMTLFSRHPNFEGTDEAKKSLQEVCGIINNSKILQSNSEKFIRLSKKAECDKNLVLTKQRMPIVAIKKAVG